MKVDDCSIRITLTGFCNVYLPPSKRNASVDHLLWEMINSLLVMAGQSVNEEGFSYGGYSETTCY